MYAERCKFLGRGPEKVVAVHGWFSDRRAYERIWPYLDAASFTWAFVDLRGYGAARDLPGEHTMNEISSDIAGLLDELGWERAHLVGHSMGGMAVQRTYALHPDRVSSLVGISPVPPGGVPFDEQGWELFSGAAEDPAKRREILDMTTGRRLTSAWLDAATRHSVDCSDRTAFADYLRAWAQTDFSSEVAGAEVPFLVIAGERDPALSPQTMQQTIIGTYKNAVLEVLQDAGHYAMDEAPLATVSLVERFLHSH